MPSGVFVGGGEKVRQDQARDDALEGPNPRDRRLRPGTAGEGSAAGFRFSRVKRTAWRIVKRKKAVRAFSGTVPGWPAVDGTAPGTTVVHVAQIASLAMLEILVTCHRGRCSITTSWVAAQRPSSSRQEREASLCSLSVEGVGRCSNHTPLTCPHGTIVLASSNDGGYSKDPQPRTCQGGHGYPHRGLLSRGAARGR